RDCFTLATRWPQGDDGSRKGGRVAGRLGAALGHVVNLGGIQLTAVAGAGGDDLAAGSASALDRGYVASPSADEAELTQRAVVQASAAVDAGGELVFRQRRGREERAETGRREVISAGGKLGRRAIDGPGAGALAARHRLARFEAPGANEAG